MKKIVVALVLVAVIAIGATAVFFVLNDDDDNEIVIPEFGEETGTVFGNSDGNYVIDKTDKVIAEKIIAGELDASKFPFADANVDGKVDQKDVDMIQDIIDKKPMKLNVLETYDSETNQKTIIPVQYPIKRAVILSGSNLAPIVDALHMTDVIVGAAYNHINEVRDYDIYKGYQDGSIKEISVDGSPADLDIISKLDVDVMLCEKSKMYDLDSDTNVKTLNEWGIDVLRMECRDPGEDLTVIAVYGILLDKSAEAQAYADFLKDVEEDIKKIEGSKYGSEKALLSSNKGGLAGTTSGYTGMIETAGGKNVADWPESNKKVAVGADWIYEEKYETQYALFGASCYYNEGYADSDIAAYKEKYSNIEAWKNGDVYIFSTSIPPIVRIAYMAECLYPDLFGDGYGDKIHQQFIDNFYSEKLDYKVPADYFCKKIN